MSHLSDDWYLHPIKGRLAAAGLTVVSLMGLAMNHYLAGSRSQLSLLLLIFAPTGLFLGIGGMLEPKVLVALGKYGKQSPLAHKVIAGILCAGGVISTLLVLLFVYRLGPSR